MIVSHTERLDAIVVDVILPDLDGLALCDRLLASAATASIPPSHTHQRRSATIATRRSGT